MMLVQDPTEPGGPPPPPQQAVKFGPGRPVWVCQALPLKFRQAAVPTVVVIVAPR